MSAEVLFGLIFITTAFIGRIFLEADNAGVFDVIAARLINYIDSKIKWLEGEDI